MGPRGPHTDTGTWGMHTGTGPGAREGGGAAQVRSTRSSRERQLRQGPGHRTRGFAGHRPPLPKGTSDQGRGACGRRARSHTREHITNAHTYFPPPTHTLLQSPACSCRDPGRPRSVPGVWPRSTETPQPLGFSRPPKTPRAGESGLALGSKFQKAEPMSG